MNKLNNMNELSRDLTKMYTLFTHMSENFHQKAKHVSQMEILREAVGKRAIVKVKKGMVFSVSETGQS